MADADKFREEQMMRLQGKDYLPVAPRVVLFRADHPDWCIHTSVDDIGDDLYVYAVISRPADGGMEMVASAHKRVRKDGKGPAAQWPLETAETGAVGRALALCGYGTLAGDLDEGDQIADAPVERSRKSGPGKKSEPEADDAGDWPSRIRRCTSRKQLEGLRSEALAYTNNLAPDDPERLQIIETFNEMKGKLS